MLETDGDAQAVGQAVFRHLAHDDAARGEESVGGFRRRRVGESQQQEIGDARRHAVAELGQLLGQPDAPALVMVARLAGEGDVLDGGDAGRLGRRADVERHADAVEMIDQARRAVGPAEPQAAHGVDLREGARHDDIVALADRGIDQFDAGRIIVGGDELGIGRVDHQHDVVRQAGAQPRHLAVRQIAAGRVVRIGDIDQLGARRDLGQQLVDIGREIGLARRHRQGADRMGGDRIDQEPMLAVEHLVAGAGIGAGEQAENLVGAGAADNALGIEAVARADRLAQRDGAAIRVAMHAGGGLVIGLDGARARAQSALVRRQLHRIGIAGDLRLAADIGFDGVDARPQHGTARDQIGLVAAHGRTLIDADRRSGAARSRRPTGLRHRRRASPHASRWGRRRRRTAPGGRHRQR
jgi:hypothetical protein